MDSHPRALSFLLVCCIAQFADAALGQSLSIIKKGGSEYSIEATAPPDTRYVLQASGNLHLWVFLCLAHPPREFTNWFQTFGVWSDPPESVTAGEFHQDVVTSAIQNPVEYVHLADTTSRGRMGLGGVQFHTFRTNAVKEVHARHNNAANGWFFDGHAEGLKRTRLESFGISALFGPDTIPSYVP